MAFLDYELASVGEEFLLPRCLYGPALGVGVVADDLGRVLAEVSNLSFKRLSFIGFCD